MIKKHRQGCENWKNAKKSFKKKKIIKIITPVATKIGQLLGNQIKNTTILKNCRNMHQG